MNFEQKLKKLGKIQHVSVDSAGDKMVARMRNVFVYADDYSSEREAAVAEGDGIEEAIDNLWKIVTKADVVSMFKGFTNSQECFWDGRKFVPRGTFEFIKQQRAKKKKKKPAEKNRFNMLEM